MPIAADSGGTPASAARSPRVTVFIPTYNRAEWLGESITSALAQTYEDFVLVVSDNGSTDETPDVVAAFDDPRLRYVRLERNIGLNSHFNRCYDTAATEYMFLIPDDDRMRPDALERTIPVLDENPTVGLVHGCADLVDGDGEIIAAGHHMSGLEGSAIQTAESFVRSAIDRGYTVHASTALIRTKALERTRLRHEDFPVTDVGLWMRVALSWDIAFLARTLAVVSIHSSAYTADGRGVTHDGYVQHVDVIEKLHEVKLRFLDREDHRFEDEDELRRLAHRARRRDLLDLAGHMTIPERRLLPTARALAGVTRHDPAVALEWRTWRLLGASVLGRRTVERLKHRGIETDRAAAVGGRT
jgi:glycosyltransferase involved in cell wall biosynthesis